MYMSNWDVNFGEVADHFLELCVRDAQCASKFLAVGLRNTVDEVVKGNGAYMRCGWHLKSSSATTFTSLVNNALGMLLMRSRTRAAIPALALRLYRCSYDDVRALRVFMDAFVDSLVAPSEEDAFGSSLLYYLIVFSEMWEVPTPTASVLTSRFANATMSTGPIASMFPSYCRFTQDNSSACSSYVSSSRFASPRAPAVPIAYKKDKYWNKAATIPADASVLILSGKLDPQTPHKYAERLLAALDGPAARKELVTFDYSEHGTLFATKLPDAVPGSATCGMMVLASYVRGSGDLSKLDKSCVKSLTMSFKLSKKDALLMFNTTDAYDGEFVFASSDDAQDETEERYLTPFVVLLALAVVLGVAIGAMYWKKRRAARAAQAAKDEDALPQPATEEESEVAASPSATDSQYIAAEEARV
ncbi:hypothetical protein PybrP1_008890 [[Pythium] brassicae (nom. inval.)]|nr:hypothetical protein PybrP1_008890 [[Pythium] brassicae (nom. inval.)]